MANRILEVYLVKPKATTNLFANPSFENATTGWTATGAGVSITRESTEARRGLYSLEVHTASGVVSGAYYSVSLTAGTKYTFSVDVLDQAGPTFNIYFANTSGVLQGTGFSWTGTGHWHRYSATFTPGSTTTYRCYVTRSAYADTENYWIDGALLEAGNESTYFDGYYKGYNPYRKDYWWTGSPTTSTSYRSQKTRTGGEIVRLRDYASILGFIGLGMAPVMNFALPSNGDGAFYQNTRTTEREIALSIQISGDDYGEIMANRAALIDAVDPNAAPDSEPMRMRIVTTNDAGVWQSEMLDFPVHYAGGLDGAVDAEFGQTTDKAIVRFNLYLPYVTGDGETAVNLTTGTSLTNPFGVLYKDYDGQWKADMNIPLATETAALVLPARDGSVYVGGNFLNAGGQANADYLAKWNGTAYEALGAWALNGQVYAIVEGPDGSIYVGGDFTNAGGVANADYIFKWDGTNVTALGTGGSGGGVDVLAFDRHGNLYAGGGFTSMGGVANTAHIAKWDGSAWSAMGTGTSTGYVLAIAVSRTSSDVYIGGLFTSAGGVADTEGIAKWNGSAWVSIGSTAGLPNIVNSLLLASDGYLYAGGTFNSVDSVSADGLARWNGWAWEAIPSIAGNGLGTGATVSVIKEIDGVLYLGGHTYSSLLGPSDILKLIGGKTFVPLDVTFDSPMVYSIATDGAGRIYLGLSENTTATSSVVNVENASGARSYPRFVIDGPGTLHYVKNETTGKGMYFSGLTTLAGEELTLNFQNNTFSFVSNWRGNVAEYVQPSSDFDFYLQNGTNNITFFISGSTAQTRVIMYYTPGYSSIDKTER